MASIKYVTFYVFFILLPLLIAAILAWQQVKNVVKKEVQRMLHKEPSD